MQVNPQTVKHLLRVSTLCRPLLRCTSHKCVNNNAQCITNRKHHLIAIKICTKSNSMQIWVTIRCDVRHFLTHAEGLVSLINHQSSLYRSCICNAKLSFGFVSHWPILDYDKHFIEIILAIFTQLLHKHLWNGGFIARKNANFLGIWLWFSTSCRGVVSAYCPLL